MAFATSGLALMASGPRNWWDYGTTDAIATVTAAGYFNSVAGVLRVGDMLTVRASTGGTPTMDILFVTANTGSVVTVVSAATTVSS